MIEISFLFGELLLAGVWLAVRGIIALRRGKIDWKREAALLLLWFNFAVLLRLTFYPFSRVEGRVQPLLFDPARVWPFRVNLVPLVHILEFDSRGELLLNVLGNPAMFIPSGILFPALFPRLDRFWKVTAAGALLSLSIELLQLPFYVRATDIDDLLLNTLGCALGYGIFALCRKLRRKGQKTAKV